MIRAPAVIPPLLRHTLSNWPPRVTAEVQTLSLTTASYNTTHSSTPTPLLTVLNKPLGIDLRNTVARHSYFTHPPPWPKTSRGPGWLRRAKPLPPSPEQRRKHQRITKEINATINKTVKEVRSSDSLTIMFIHQLFFHILIFLYVIMWFFFQLKRSILFIFWRHFYPFYFPSSSLCKIKWIINLKELKRRTK